MKYSCDQCDSMFAFKGALTTHIKSKHEGVRYYCDQCDNMFTFKGALNTHIQFKHNRVGYYCDQCDNIFTTKGSLNLHKQYKHEGVRYCCHQCHHQATSKGNLAKHIKLKHKGVRWFSSNPIDTGCPNTVQSTMTELHVANLVFRYMSCILFHNKLAAIVLCLIDPSPRRFYWIQTSVK